MEKTLIPEGTTIDNEAARAMARHDEKSRPFADTVQFCGKCCRKLHAEGKTLRKAVKAAIRDAYGNDVALKKFDCFLLCPKSGQVLSTRSALHGRRLVIVHPDSNVTNAVEYLLKDTM